MTTQELKSRTKKFAIAVIKMVELLPRTKAASVVEYQIVKSSTSVGANYRAACRARSKADFISKITIVEEEIDESAYWIEIIQEAEMIAAEKLSELLKEANELTAIFTSTGKTARNNK